MAFEGITSIISNLQKVVGLGFNSLKENLVLVLVLISALYKVESELELEPVDFTKLKLKPTSGRLVTGRNQN